MELTKSLYIKNVHKYLDFLKNKRRKVLNRINYCKMRNLPVDIRDKAVFSTLSLAIATAKQTLLNNNSKNE